MVIIAQPGRAADYGSAGRWFKSIFPPKRQTMKQLLIVLSVWLLLSSCAKTGITPVKTFTSIEGTWSVNQPTVNYSATFDIVKGDASYPYYVHNITERYNNLTYSYSSGPQGVIELPNNLYNILLPFNNGMVTFASLTVNTRFTSMTAVSGFLQSGVTTTNFASPVNLTRLH
jgi:hypothetical protein